MRPRPTLDPNRPEIHWDEIKHLKPAERLTIARDFKIIGREVIELDVKLTTAEQLTRARAEIAAQNKK